MIARIAAVALIAVGLMLAAKTVPLPAPASMMAFGYVVLAGDFHVHGFPDGILPADAVRDAQRRRLDVIALTSHNSLRGWWLWTHAPSSGAGEGMIVLPGEELTSVGYHMAIVGLSRIVAWHQPLTASAREAHAQEAVAILAHPSGEAFKRYVTDDGLRAVDGVEVAHPGSEISNQARKDFVDIYRRAVTLNPRVAAIGSSDFHFLGPIGLCRTYLFARERTAAGVLDALRAGRTAACDARGRVYGPPELASVVAERCRDEAAAPPAGDTRASRAGTVLAWAGLVALVLLGPSPS